jgi:anti-sigma regulatory factor (Ser/Thr protein kinase)
MSEITIEAKIENLDEVLGFVDGQLEELECPMKAQMQIDVAVEEIFVNIASYAYAPGVGNAVVRFESSQDPASVTITFIDSGIPYDPVRKDDPDVTLSAEERGIGGLGIYMAKKAMDDMKYVYRDGQNILSISKSI